MIHNFQVPENTLASKILFFSQTEMENLPNLQIVPLFGANGSGKTTVLRGIGEGMTFLTSEKEIEQKEKNAKTDDDIDEINYLKRLHSRRGKEYMLKLDIDNCPTAWYSYKNSTDNFRSRQANSIFDDFNPVFIKRRMDAQALSEGQSIMYSVKDLLEGMLPSTKTRESFIEDDNQHAIVLLDEIDSGLSLDNLDQCLRIMKRAVKLRKNVQFIFSFNTSYVLRYFPDVLSMYDGKVLHLKGEDDMLAELKKHKDMLRKARQKSNGEYRIFS